MYAKLRDFDGVFSDVRKRSCSHRLLLVRWRKVGRKFEPKTRGKKPNVFSWLYAECRKEEGNARASCVALSIKMADQPLCVCPFALLLRVHFEFSLIVNFYHKIRVDIK